MKELSDEIYEIKSEEKNGNGIKWKDHEKSEKLQVFRNDYNCE